MFLATSGQALTRFGPHIPCHIFKNMSSKHRKRWCPVFKPTPVPPPAEADAQQGGGAGGGEEGLLILIHLPFNQSQIIWQLIEKQAALKI